jgi:hypothetical protein
MLAVGVESSRSGVESEDNEWASAEFYYEQSVAMVNGCTIAE